MRETEGGIGIDPLKRRRNPDRWATDSTGEAFAAGRIVTATFSDHGCMEFHAVHPGSRTARSSAAMASTCLACQLAARIERIANSATPAIRATCQTAFKR